jgi:hypothetical protein
MPRIRKTKEEIKSFLAQYQQVFEYYTENKLEIPKPRLTSTISESLVAWLIEEKELLSNLSIEEVGFSKSGGDLEVTTSNRNILKVEVKSTGANGFQYFGEKDLDAHYLIWVHFGHMLADRNIRKVEILTIEGQKLRKHIGELPKSRKVALSKVKIILPDTETFFYEI